MQYHALAADYDGTLANEGVMAEATVAALRRLANSGRRILLVTGRELPDLLSICPQIDVFDWVVAENGALLYSPHAKQSVLIAPPPPAEFVNELRRRNVRPLSVGQCIVSTLDIYKQIVLDVTHEFGLELQVIFNKASIMVLPTGIDKAVGLDAALQRLNLSPRNVVAIGDGENDYALFAAVGYSAAVANAVPILKQVATRTLRYANGEGCIELMEELMANDLGGDLGEIDALLPNKKF